MRTKKAKDPVKEVIESITPEEIELQPIDVNFNSNVMLLDGLDDDFLNEKEPSTFEIAPGATVEEVKAMFFDQNAFVEPPVPIYRLDRSGHRYYYNFDENGEPVFYPSITTLIKQTMPTSEFLIKWISNMGYERAETYKNERASYGTFMHAEFADMIINRMSNLDTLKGRLLHYIHSKNLPLGFIDYADDIRKNMLSMAQFIIDVKLEPLAIEIPLVHPEMKFAATLDMPCYMTLKGERFRAIIDFKSGKNFYEENEVQLHGQKECWNYHYPDKEITRVFNWRPKDWRIRPTYELQEQTKSPNAEKLKYIVAIAQIEDKKVDNMLTVCKGVINLDQGINENYKSYTLAELVKNSRKEKEPEKSNDVVVFEKQDNNVAVDKPKRSRKPGSVAKKTKKSTNTRQKKEGPVKELKKAKNEKSKKLLDDNLDI